MDEYGAFKCPQEGDSGPDVAGLTKEPNPQVASLPADSTETLPGAEATLRGDVQSPFCVSPLNPPGEPKMRPVEVADGVEAPRAEVFARVESDFDRADVGGATLITTTEVPTEQERREKFQVEIDDALQPVRERHRLKTLGVTVHNCDSLADLRAHKGPKLVCLAGFTQMGDDVFEKVINVFSEPELEPDSETTQEKVIIITFDAPGSKGTTFNEDRLADLKDRCGKEEYAAIVEEALIALCDGDPEGTIIVMGHSLGGLVAPLVFPKMGILRVLFAPAYKTTGLFQTTIWALQIFNPIARRLPFFLKEWMAVVLMNPLVPRKFARQYTLQLFGLDAAAIRKVFGPLTQAVDPWEALKDIDARQVLVLLPKKDRIVDSKYTWKGLLRKEGNRPKIIGTDGGHLTDITSTIEMRDIKAKILQALKELTDAFTTK